MIRLISELSSSILNKNSVQDVLQTAVNRSVDKLDFIGAIIFLVDEDKKLYAKTISAGNISQKLIKLLQNPVTEIKLDIESESNNFLVQSVVNKEVRKSDSLFDFTNGFLIKSVSKTAEFITGAKSCICVPLVNKEICLGTVLFIDRERTDFSEKIENLKLLANLISIGIINAKNYEDLSESLRTQKEMMNVLAHEIKTPLTVIKNSVELLDVKVSEELAIDEKIPKLIKMIKRNIDKEVYLLNSVLNSAKVDNDTLEFLFDKVEIPKILNDEFQFFKVEAKSKGLDFYISSAPKITIETDEMRLSQVLGNLISNAIKYTDSGEVEIGAAKRGKFIEFYVRDTGQGISREDVKKLGKKFFRIESENPSNSYNGTGIGLYIAFGIIKKLGGTYNIKSSLGKGSRFSFKLPI